MNEKKGLETLVKKTVKVNNNIFITYDNEEEIANALYKRYGTQGNLYLKVFGVEEDDAQKAGWHPEDSDFDDRECDGWTKFLEDYGEIRKMEKTEEIAIKDLIEKMFKK